MHPLPAGHGLDRRLALLLLCTRWAGKSPGTLLAAVGLAVTLISMWISNTAACAMVCPVTLGIIAGGKLATPVRFDVRPLVPLRVKVLDERGRPVDILGLGLVGMPGLLAFLSIVAALAIEPFAAFLARFKKHLAKVEQHRALNAFITETPDKAREMAQVADRGNLALTEEQYLEIIEGKTAELCAISCSLGAHYAGGSREVCAALDGYGRSLGMAFQIADDVLDVEGAPVRGLRHVPTGGEAHLVVLQVVGGGREELEVADVVVVQVRDDHVLHRLRFGPQEPQAFGRAADVVAAALQRRAPPP